MSHFPRIRELIKVSVFLVPTLLYVAFVLVAYGQERWALGLVILTGVWAMAFPTFLPERRDSPPEEAEEAKPLWWSVIRSFGQCMIVFWLLDLIKPELNAFWARLRDSHALLDCRLFIGLAVIALGAIMRGNRRCRLITDKAILEYYALANPPAGDAKVGCN